jgi:hypothetical protein
MGSPPHRSRSSNSPTSSAPAVASSPT